MAFKLPKSKKKKAATVQAKKDSTYNAEQKKKFDRLSDPYKACKNLKGTRRF